MLLLDNDVIIKEETKILNEVTRFSGELFQSTRDSPDI